MAWELGSIGILIPVLVVVMLLTWGTMVAQFVLPLFR